MIIDSKRKDTIGIGAWFRPLYDELTIYVISLTCVLLTISHPEFFEGYCRAWNSVHGKETGWLLAISALALACIILSLYHVVVKREKENWEKTIMASFAMAANGVAGIVGGKELLPDIWSVSIDSASLEHT